MNRWLLGGFRGDLDRPPLYLENSLSLCSLTSSFAESMVCSLRLLPNANAGRGLQWFHWHTSAHQRCHTFVRSCIHLHSCTLACERARSQSHARVRSLRRGTLRDPNLRLVRKLKSIFSYLLGASHKRFIRFFYLTIYLTNRPSTIYHLPSTCPLLPLPSQTINASVCLCVGRFLSPHPPTLEITILLKNIFQ